MWHLLSKIEFPPKHKHMYKYGERNGQKFQIHLQERENKENIL